jgi:3-methyladenine DNA glycosylase AlkD
MINNMDVDVQYRNILKRLQSLSNPRALTGLSRFGINLENAYGISIPQLRTMAKEIGRNHNLAQQLWKSRIHEARILASYIEEPQKITEAQLEKWVKDFNSWDVCDQVCNLFEETPYAYQKAMEWSSRREEFVKRAAFAIMAGLAIHDKKAGDDEFKLFFPIIKRAATDDRNFVKKAVNWALRNIGKRNRALNASAIALAREIQRMDSKTAKWIASDALRELTSQAVKKRIYRKLE